MIQRSQSLYLLGVIATCLVMLFSGKYFAEISSDVTVATVSYMKTDLASAKSPQYPVITKNTLLIGHVSAIAVLSLFTLLMFKNRKLQIQLVSLNFLLIVAVCGTMYYYVNDVQKLVTGIPSTVYTLMGMYPVILLIFNFLAFRGIRKDTALVKSMDRLR